MGKQSNTGLPKTVTNATIQVNGIRILVASSIWGGLFTGGYLLLLLPTFLVTEDPRERLNLLLSLPSIGMMGFSMPILLLFFTLIVEVLMTPFKSVVILKFLFGLFIPSSELVTALVMMVADPIMHILWRIHPPLIPVQEYKWIMFCCFVQVEAA